VDTQHKKDLSLNTGILCPDNAPYSPGCPRLAAPSVAPGQTEGLQVMLTTDMVLHSPHPQRGNVLTSTLPCFLPPSQQTKGSPEGYLRRDRQAQAAMPRVPPCSSARLPGQQASPRWGRQALTLSCLRSLLSLLGLDAAGRFGWWTSEL